MVLCKAALVLIGCSNIGRIPKLFVEFQCIVCLVVLELLIESA